MPYSSYDHDKLETAETMRIERRIYFEAKDGDIAPYVSCLLYTSRLSGRMATRLYPSFVGISFLPLRSAKPAEMSFSMIPARVAVVPNPLRSASSGVSSLPAFSIADRSVSSVYAFGGCV